MPEKVTGAVSPPELPSVDDIKPDDEGGPIARAGFNYQDGNTFALKAMAVNSNTPFSQVQAWIDQAIAQKTWVILIFHKIQNAGDDSSDIYWSSPQAVQQIADYLKTANAKVITTSEGVYQMTHN